MQTEPGPCSNKLTSLVADPVRQAVPYGDMLSMLSDIRQSIDKVKSEVAMLGHTVLEQEAELAELQSDFAATRQEQSEVQAHTSSLKCKVASLGETLRQNDTSISELGEKMSTTTRCSIQLEAWTAMIREGKPSCS